MTDLIVQMFLAAARVAARYPEPERATARFVLVNAPAEFFDEEVDPLRNLTKWGWFAE